MTRNFVMALALIAALVVLAATFAADVFAAEWRVAQGAPERVCEPLPQRDPDVRLGPAGPYQVVPEPRCNLVQHDRAQTYYIVHGQFVPDNPKGAQVGAPCFQPTRLDHFWFGLTEPKGVLWALCTNR